jgi:hypothetical protein
VEPRHHALSALCTPLPILVDLRRVQVGSCVTGPEGWGEGAAVPQAGRVWGARATVSQARRCGGGAGQGVPPPRGGGGPPPPPPASGTVSQAQRGGGAPPPHVRHFVTGPEGWGRVLLPLTGWRCWQAGGLLMELQQSLCRCYSLTAQDDDTPLNW